MVHWQLLLISTTHCKNYIERVEYEPQSVIKELLIILRIFERCKKVTVSIYTKISYSAD